MTKATWEYNDTKYRCRTKARRVMRRKLKQLAHKRARRERVTT
jgi:hypothetical protein